MFYLKRILSVKNVKMVGQLRPPLPTEAQLQKEKPATEWRQRLMNERIKSGRKKIREKLKLK